MEGYEVDACLDTFEIVVDTREQPSEKATRRYRAFGCPYSRATLNYGDYTYNFSLPNGEKVYREAPICGDVVIERKMSLEELSGCFCQTRERFSHEFERAINHGAKVYLLTENASWEKLMSGKYNTHFNSSAYLASIITYMARYNITPIFCKEEVSGKLIKAILYRELRERLLKGDYDESI